MNNYPIDISKAISNNAYMVFQKFPELPFFIKTLQLPAITTGTTRISFPQHHAWNIPSVQSDVDDITIMWYLDENLLTYFKMISWLRECRSVDDVTTAMTDATVTITNNAKQPLVNIHLFDCWVSNVGTLDFDTYNADPITPFFTLKTHGFSWEYLDKSLDIYNGLS